MSNRTNGVENDALPCTWVRMPLRRYIFPCTWIRISVCKWIRMPLQMDTHQNHLPYCSFNSYALASGYESKSVFFCTVFCRIPLQVDANQNHFSVELLMRMPWQVDTLFSLASGYACLYSCVSIDTLLIYV